MLIINTQNYLEMNNMVRNICIKCSREVWVKSPSDHAMTQMLKESDIVVCNICDPVSGWRRVKVHGEA